MAVAKTLCGSKIKIVGFEPVQIPIVDYSYAGAICEMVEFTVMLELCRADESLNEASNPEVRVTVTARGADEPIDTNSARFFCGLAHVDFDIKLPEDGADVYVTAHCEGAHAIRMLGPFCDPSEDADDEDA